MANKEKEKLDIFKLPIILMALQGVMYSYGGIAWLIEYFKPEAYALPQLRFILLQLGLGLSILSSAIGLMKNKKLARWSTIVIYTIFIIFNGLALLLELAALRASMPMIAAYLLGSSIPVIFIVMLLKNKDRFNS